MYMPSSCQFVITVQVFLQQNIWLREDKKKMHVSVNMVEIKIRWKVDKTFYLLPRLYRTIAKIWFFISVCPKIAIKTLG